MGLFSIFSSLYIYLLLRTPVICSSFSKSIIEFLSHVENVKEEIEKNKIIKDGVILSTIHGVKGMEFKNVFIRTIPQFIKSGVGILLFMHV